MGKFCSKTNKVEHHFGNSRQSVGGGNTPTAIIQRTNDSRSSTFNGKNVQAKGNNVSAPSFD